MKKTKLYKKDPERSKNKKVRYGQRYLREERAAYAFLLPSLVGTFVFTVIPILMSLILGFTKWDPMKKISETEFVGLENFKVMMSDARIISALRNNLVYSLSYVPLTIIIALLLAGLLNKYVFGKVQMRMMMFMPYISSLVSVATVWMVLLYPDNGPINAILTSVFGIQNPPTWFVSSKWALFGIILMSVWHDVGYYVIIILANMQGFSSEIYEAAAVDGANGIKTFFRITVPMLSSTLFFCITLATINSFKIFDQVNIITEGGPGFSTTVLVQAIYYYAFKEFKFGYAAAGAILLFIVIFTVTRILQALEKRYTY